MSASKTSKFQVGSDSVWSKAGFQASVALAVVGLVLCGLAFAADPARLGYAYLFGLMTTLTLVLGGLFFVIIMHFTGAHWGITSRRLAEVIASGAGILFVLWLPFIGGVVTGKFPMYDEWLHQGHAEHAEEHASTGAAVLGESVASANEHDAVEEESHPHSPQMEAAHHHLLAKKTGYLNVTRWAVFGFVYWLVWIGFSQFYLRSSLKQDGENREASIASALKMKKYSAIAAILFGFSLTFAAFDWMMALEPTWYSTIFGVVVFAGAAMSIFALLIVMGVSLYQRGLIGQAINTEHFHDLGKMMFGFMCFWAYVSFSQWMLIWYAGIPEESTWFQKRWTDGWQVWALVLMIGHFTLPFYFLISRMVKRRLGMLQFGAAWLLVMHVADIYFLIVPQAGAFSLGAADIGALLLCGGALFAYIFKTLAKHPLVPAGDPRLSRALHHHQSH